MAQMQEAADQAQERVGEAAGQAKNKAREQIDQRSTEAGERVSTTAQDVRSVGEQLRSQGKDGPARIADQVADRAERFGGYLKDSDSDRILSDVESYGRNQPWAFAAGGLLLGFAASRFLKASSRNRYRTSQGSLASSSGNGARSHDARTDRELGGPTPAAPPVAPGTGTPAMATGSAAGSPSSGRFEPNR